LHRAVRTVCPDLIFVIKGEAIRPGVISAFAAQGITTANWILDEPFGKHSKFNRVRNLPEYHRVFCFDDRIAQQLQKWGISASYLPVGADPALHHEIIPVSERHYERDVAFLGSHHPQREQLFTTLARSGIRLSVSGYRWNQVPKSSPLFPVIDPRTLRANKTLRDAEAMCRYFNLTKINLNLHHAQAIGAGASLRLFECGATNSFLISDYKPGLEKLYRPNREIAFYRTADELKQKISYFLAHDAERLRIAKAGQRRTLRNHTVLQRIQTVLKTLHIRNAH
ncbi:MAG TPA: glycosyltransferase, partial [Candidatus Nanoarchaeia archaeon]|nr:glycosyltransferase [Candidatus Nanoarchaeia archaeon]